MVWVKILGAQAAVIRCEPWHRLSELVWNGCRRLVGKLHQKPNQPGRSGQT